jgi:hypothetical protein
MARGDMAKGDQAMGEMARGDKAKGYKARGERRHTHNMNLKLRIFGFGTCLLAFTILISISWQI